MNKRNYSLAISAIELFSTSLILLSQYFNININTIYTNNEDGFIIVHRDRMTDTKVMCRMVKLKTRVWVADVQYVISIYIYISIYLYYILTYRNICTLQSSR